MKPGSRIGTATVLSVQHGLPPAPQRARRSPDPTWGVSSSGWWCIAFRVGCRVISEANRPSGEHWSKANKRKRAQCKATTLAWLCVPGGVDRQSLLGNLPFTVTLIHHGPKMDGDNLQRAFKAVRDRVARLIGVDDGDERVTWLYDQDGAEPGITIRIEGGRKP